MALFSARSADPLLQQRSADRNAELRRLALGPWALAGYVVAVAAGIFVAPWLWVGLTIVVVACTYYYADKKARADWWESVVRTIGMVPDVPELDFSTPLLRSGDERTVKSKASDATRSLALFTSTDVSRDSNGNREEADHNYTLVIYDFTSGSGPVPPRVFLSAHKRRALGLGDEHRGQFPAGVKDFDLESVELNKRFNLRCDADQVGLLHAVFEPAFMVWFQEHGLPFEFESGKLVVIQKHFEDRLDEFSELLATADAIHKQLTQQLLPS